MKSVFILTYNNMEMEDYSGFFCIDTYVFYICCTDQTKISIQEFTACFTEMSRRTNSGESANNYNLYRQPKIIELQHRITCTLNQTVRTEPKVLFMFKRTHLQIEIEIEILSKNTIC